MLCNLLFCVHDCVQTADHCSPLTAACHNEFDSTGPTAASTQTSLSFMPSIDCWSFTGRGKKPERFIDTTLSMRSACVTKIVLTPIQVFKVSIFIVVPTLSAKSPDPIRTKPFPLGYKLDPSSFPSKNRLCQVRHRCYCPRHPPHQHHQ